MIFRVQIKSEKYIPVENTFLETEYIPFSLHYRCNAT